MYLGFRVYYTLHVRDSMFIVTLCSSSIIIYVLRGYTLHVLDSMFIVTLCSSSIIIYVLSIIRNTSFARTFSPSTTPISLLCVFTFDLANPWEGLHVTPKMCHFTTRSVAFSRSTTPIHRKKRAGTQKL